MMGAAVLLFITGAGRYSTTLRFNEGLERPHEVKSGMSAIGTKRTLACALHMSAIGGKADIALCAANVCF